MKNYSLGLLITLMVLAAGAAPAMDLAVCQNGCNGQYYSTTNTLWQAQRPATDTPATHQQRVMTALNSLNKCMADCSAGTIPSFLNLALNKTASATLQNNGYEAAKAVDDNVTTYWSAKSSSSQSIKVDLGRSLAISMVRLDWGISYAKSYLVQASTDGSNWTTVVSITSATGGIREHTFTARTARYVRVSCSSASSSSGYAIKELGVFQ